MTLKEFSRKYDIPYYLVYEASYRVKAVETIKRDRDYPESDLFQATMLLINKRIQKYHKLVVENKTAKEKLTNRRSEGWEQGS